MKTLILQLDPHDDIISARDKMGWSQTGRILLVWPQKGRVLNKKIDLILLQRHSEAIGAQLALVSRDSDVLFHANRLAIPTFKDVKKAKRSHWRVDKRVRREITRFEKAFEDRKQQTLETMQSSGFINNEVRYQQSSAETDIFSKPLHPLLRSIVFSIGIVALLSIAAVLLPSARISIKTPSKQQELSLAVRADPEQVRINLSGILPSHPKRILVEGTRSAPVESIIFIPDEPATGRVIFTNITNQSINIPEGTIVRTEGPDPIRFATTRSGSIAAGLQGQATIPVRALQAGENGNLPVGSLVAIEGPLGLNLTVTNPYPTQGGKDRPVNAPEESEYVQIFEDLSRELYFAALQEAESSLAPDDLLLKVSPSPTKVLEKAYDPIETQPSDHLSLTLSLEFMAWYVSGADLKALAEGVLDANLQSGLVPERETLKVTQVTEPIISDEGVARWQLEARRQVHLAIDENQAANLILGMPIQQASQRIVSRFNLADTPQIRITPDWWRRLPWLPFRISFEINQ